MNWGAQILSIYAAPMELVPNLLRHSYKDFAPTEHVPLCDVCAVQFKSLARQRNPPFGADTHTTQRRANFVRLALARFLTSAPGTETA